MVKEIVAAQPKAAAIFARAFGIIHQFVAGYVPFGQ